MNAPVPDFDSMRGLALRLDDARAELEATWQAIARDAQWDGVLVVAPIEESLDLSWLLCCSRPTRRCETAHRHVRGGVE